METGKRSLRSIWAKAIMEGKAIVIVEAWEDRQIYSKLAEKFGIKNILFYPPTYFQEGKNDDNTNVIDLIRAIVQNESYNTLPKSVLGIIDRDYRPYKLDEKHPELNWEEVVKIPSLFILKHYSVETYFATPYNLQEMICATTKAISDDIPLNEIITLIKNKQQVLYYLGLSALKMHCSEESSKLDDYSKITLEKLTHFEKEILPSKKQELEDFALLILVPEDTIQKIVIGKWYLHYWVVQTRKWLADKSTSEPIFNFRSHQKNNDLYEAMKNFFDKNEFEDIIVVLSSLKVEQK